MRTGSTDFEQSPRFSGLAEAYLDSGDKTLAIQFYEKSLALDPSNSNAADQLKKLRE